MLGYDMQYFKYNRGTLLDCWYGMFQQFDLIEKFKINPLKMQQFLAEVCRKYQRVPFHNMTHAFNVTHACFYVICQIRRKEQTNNILDIEQSPHTSRNSLLKESFLTDLNIFSLLIASLGHDLDHPGLGNTYFQKARDYRAITVNNASILEHYHLHCLMGLLEKTNLLSSFNYEQAKEVRETIQEIILSTDMTLHFNL